jgi:hypothetical protein
MKIHGIVLTRNDWGVLTVAIGHAFNHVDVIHVLNHGSDDQTAHGLAVLQSMWGDRLKVYSASPEVLFDQFLLTNIVVAQAEAAGADWIYVFDSDEFLLARPGKSLRETLAGVDSQVVALRYALRNYISPAGFDKLNLDHYLRLRFKSRPTASNDPQQAWDNIDAGTSSFFNIPFPPKIFFRANSGLMVTDGAHDLRWTLSGQTVEVCRDFQSAHLPLICRETLKRKSAQGASHIKKGWPRTQGWQNQMIHQFDRQGRLDWFWARHSISNEVDDVRNPAHVVDESLVRTLGPVIRQLKAQFGGANLGGVAGKPLRTGIGDATELTFDDVFRLCGFFNHRIKLLFNKIKS